MSSNDMPELGSKISLISKADIRYEGKLYTVDPQDCTIALANVRSFGTEDRKTAHPVPAQAQIYDYILFRATDIKDISVVPPTQLLYDPAIVQLSAPSAMNNSRPFPGSSSGGTSSNDYHPLPIGGSGPMSQFSGFNPMQSNILTRPSPSEFLHHQTNSELLSGSRSSTPALRRSSPTIDQSMQSNSQKSPQKDDSGRQRNRSGSRNQDRSGNRSRHDSHNNQQNHQQQQQTHQQQNYQHNRGRSNYNQQPQQQGFNNRNNQQPHHLGGGRNQMRNQQNLGGNDRWNNRGGRGGQPQGGNRQNFSRAPGARAKPASLKFESDYDFDKANNEFEELRNELSKIKLDAPAPLPVVNGEEKKDDSGNETCVENLDQNEADPYFYDKNKSFFDNISCEAIERSKGIQRTDWRKERKLNTETFGVSSARRGMYFGRGAMRGGGGGNYGYYYNNRGNYGYVNRGGFRQPMLLYRQRSQNRQQNLNQAQVANA